MGCAAAVQTKHKDFVVRDGESPKNVFIATGELSAPLYVSPVGHLHVPYIEARQKLSRTAFVIKEA